MRRYTRKMLLKRISGAASHAASMAAKSEETFILFKENCVGQRQRQGTGHTYLNAHELFNQFTANVIKSRVTFSR